MKTTTGEAQSHIDGILVAQIIIDFNREFRGVYPIEIMASNLCAVGPLQSMIGLAIANGRLALATANPSTNEKGTDSGVAG